jgi:PST family polysaccharide transporter
MFKNKSAVSQDYFDNRQVRTDLKKHAVQGGGISIILRGLGTVIGMGGVIILARLLTPSDFGLVAMVTAITSIFVVFQDVGLTDATIQAPIINHKQISTLFWINLAFSLLITIVLIALSPAIAWFYKNPRLTLITIIFSLSFIFWGLTTQHMALLKRQMLFLRVGIIDLASSLLSTVGSIIFALLGWGYWAIVLRTILYGFIKWILTWISCRWRPGLPRRHSGVRPFLKFGVNSVGFYIINYFATNLDKAFIGKKSGAESLGYYSRAYYLSTTPSSQLTSSLFHVAVSTLSKLREEPDNFRRYYLNALSVISFVGMPLSAFMVVMSKELVYVLLGPQWSKAAEYFSILGLAAGMNILYLTNGWLHVSLGRSDRWMRWGIFSSSIMVVGFAIGSIYGALGVAVAYALLINMLVFPSILYAGKPIGLSLREVTSAVWKSTLSALLTGILFSYVKNMFFAQVGVGFRIFFSLLSYIGLYLALILLLFRGPKPIQELLSLSKFMTLRKGRS